MEILAYLHMALAYEESQQKDLSCVDHLTEECSPKNLEYAIPDRTSASAKVNKDGCFFKAAKV